jgi:hypothetical protein
MLWLDASFPALILVLSFIRFSLNMFYWLRLSEHTLTSRDRCMPQKG